MKVFITVLLLILNIHSWAKANDIRNFDIYELFIGESLNNYLEKFKIIEEKNLDEYTKVVLKQPTDDSLSIYFRTSDEDKIIKSIEVINYSNIDECLDSKEIVLKDLNQIFKNSNLIDIGKIKKKDPEINIYKSKFVTKNGSANISCYDKIGKKNGLRVSIESKEFSSWSMLKSEIPSGEFTLKYVYQIENSGDLNYGNIVYVEWTPWGDVIWMREFSTGELKKISHFFSFMGIAKKCFDEKENDNLTNSIFGFQKEYFYWGGWNEFAPIRIYNLYEKNPHISYKTDIGSVPNMEEAKSWCTFYTPLYSHPNNS